MNRLESLVLIKRLFADYTANAATAGKMDDGKSLKSLHNDIFKLGEIWSSLAVALVDSNESFLSKAYLYTALKRSCPY